METMDGGVAARADTEESHQGRKMFASNEIDPGCWQRKGRRGANKDGTTSVTSVMS